MPKPSENFSLSDGLIRMVNENELEGLVEDFMYWRERIAFLQVSLILPIQFNWSKLSSKDKKAIWNKTLEEFRASKTLYRRRLFERSLYATGMADPTDGGHRFPFLLRFDRENFCFFGNINTYPVFVNFLMWMRHRL